MTSVLQQRLRERRERAALETITERLSGLLTGRGLTAEELPGWIGEAARGFWEPSAQPAAFLPDEAEPETLTTWVEDLLRRHGIARRFYLASHLTILPWLECETPDHGWMATVREAMDDSWLFLASSLDVVAEVREQEYCYEFLVARRPG